MRPVAILYIVLAAALAGCAGGYDRELLGDPEPVAVAPAQPESAWTEEAAVADTLGYEQLIHTPADYEMFGDLRPYGEWYATDMYGVVFRPIVPAEWRPYERGHWMWTSYGWMWASYDPFGWAAYHYGTWWLDGWLGWIWVPGFVWSACPVDWFYTDAYCGWAPLPPSGCAWDDPWQDTGKYKEGWVVVEAGKFKEVDVGENRIPPARFKDQYRIGTAQRRAPDTRVIERVTRQPVKETNVRFESEHYGDRELRRVVLPSQEQQIVERFPLPTAPAQQIQMRTPVTTPGNGGGGGSPPPPSGGSDGGKVKGSPPTTPPPANSSPPKFKEKPRGGESKSKGDSKDSGKSKGGDSKGDSKDSDSPAKAKGKKR